jgi:hypothetical protein
MSIDFRPTVDELRGAFLAAANLGGRPADERAACLQQLRPTELCRVALEMEARLWPDNDAGTLRAAFAGGVAVDAMTAAIGSALVIGAAEAGKADTTRGWCMEANVGSFQTRQLLTISQGTRLEVLPRGGKANMAAVEVAAESWRIHRFAKQLLFDEQDLFDDSVGALLVAAKQLGDAAARVRPDLVYSLLLSNPTLADDVALFDAATHGNLGTGGGSALAAGSLQTGIAAVGNQHAHDEKGRPVHLNLRPGVLLVPHELTTTARGLVCNMLLGDGNDIEVRSESRLGTVPVLDPASEVSYTGTATNWLLACMGSAWPSVVVGYLDGKTIPSVRSTKLKEGQWGVAWDINLDIGVAAVDHRGLYKSAGA